LQAPSASDKKAELLAELLIEDEFAASGLSQAVQLSLVQDQSLVAAFKERPRVEWRKLMVACARRFTPCTCIAVRLLRGPLV
jgi:hypothetical protein